MIVIYHGGLNKISNSTKNKKASSNEAEKLMEEIGVIDLMITAHQHQTIVGQDQGNVLQFCGWLKRRTKNEGIHLTVTRHGSMSVKHPIPN